MKSDTVSAKPDLRLAALRRFAVSITAFNVLGRWVLGFESSWAQMFVALFTAYGVELLLEFAQARADGRQPMFMGSRIQFVNFLLPSHITGLAVSMLLYANDRLLPFMLGSALGIGSKALFRAPAASGKGWRHFMNPSNFGLAVSFLLLPDMVSAVVPYQFTADVGLIGDLGIPLFVITLGSILNVKFTQRMPVAMGWVAGFIVQAVARHVISGESLWANLGPLTGPAIIIFTFYMVPDPGTTPSRPLHQLIFGSSVGLIYGVLVAMHQVFAMFLSLTVVCVARAGLLYLAYFRARASAKVPLAAVGAPQRVSLGSDNA